MSSNLVGSRISLISKKDIRYEGTLYSIDTENASVTLQNVKSWGTENRVEGEQILPNDELFGCIVFRGMDIKDLHVHETVTDDEASHLHPNNNGNLPPPVVPPPGALTANPPSPPKSPRTGGSHAAASGSSSSSSRQQQQQHSKKTGTGAGGRSGNAASKQRDTDREGGEGAVEAKKPSSGSGGRYQPPHKNPNHKSAGRGPSSGNRGPSSSTPAAIPGTGNHLASRRTRGGTGIELEKGSFNFEAALAEFDKEAVKQEVLGDDSSAINTNADGEVIPPVKKYNKSSFFDEISCDALDKRTRSNYNAERGLNTETFGATSVAFTGNNRRFNGRGRGGYRGGGYRGGRGGGGGRSSAATADAN